MWIEKINEKNYFFIELTINFIENDEINSKNCVDLNLRNFYNFIKKIRKTQLHIDEIIFF